jgi:hypothetical protein
MTKILPDVSESSTAWNLQSGEWIMPTDASALGRHASLDSFSGAYARLLSVGVPRGWSRVGVIVAFILFLGGGVPGVKADEGKPAAGVPGMIGAINPETGQVGPPSAEQLQQLRANLGRVYTAKIAPRAPVKLDNGATMAVPGPAALSFAVTHLSPDGTLSTTCVPNMQGAIRFWSTPETQPRHAQQPESHHVLR